MGRLPFLFLLFGALIGAGCAPNSDIDRLRLCRIALVGVIGSDRAIHIEKQGGLPSPGEPTVRVDYRTGAIGGQERGGFAECRFAGQPPVAKSDDLIAFRSERGALSPASLYFLKRFWLETPEADRADPEPVAIWRGAPKLPAPLAHGAQHLVNALPGMAAYSLLAAAYALVYGLAGRINLAFGEMAAIGGAASLTGLAFVTAPGLAMLVMMAGAAAVWGATLHGIAVARWVFLPLRRSTGQQGLVATIGLALVLNEYLRLAQGPTPRWITPMRTVPFGLAQADRFTVTITPAGLVVAGLFACLIVALLLLMAKSQFGRSWRALADDATAAALMGVDPTRMFTLTFALASALAGASGAVTVLIYGSFGTSYGATLGLKALLAAILGGIGSVPGAIAGGIAISGIETAWSAFFPIEYRDLALFVLLAGALIARPGGLLGFADLSPRRV